MNGKLYIPKPCHENWDKMDQVEKGRHCGVCSKVVTDFTHMETQEIIDFLQTSKTEVCGHIRVKELSPATPGQNFQFWFKKLLPKMKLGLAALFPLFIFKSSAMAQIEQHEIINGGLKAIPHPTEDKKINITVLDNHHIPVPKATITIYFYEMLMVTLETDINGKATTTLQLYDADVEAVRIKVEAAGFVDRELKSFPVRKKEQSLEIRMDEEITLLGNMIYNPMIVEEMVETVPEQISCIEEPVDTSERINTPGKLTVETFFILYPNPTSGLVKIVTDRSEAFDVVVYDSKGTSVFSISNCLLNTEFDLGNKAAGNYSIVVLVKGEAIETHKIILVK